jgi:hypothetical protein
MWSASASTLANSIVWRMESDHWSFWREGFPALMATDTAPLRYPYYHKRADTPDKVNFAWLSQIVSGFRAVVADVAKTC